MDVRCRYPDLVTVLLTAQADLQLVLSAINDGHIHRFFTKPWNSADLRAELRELILGEGGGDRRLDKAVHTEERLHEELLPMRDVETGAFIIEDPSSL